MACYRNGGCGPYEMRSCSECPASKPEYAVRQAIIKARPWAPQDMIDNLHGERLVKCVEGFETAIDALAKDNYVPGNPCDHCMSGSYRGCDGCDVR